MPAMQQRHLPFTTVYLEPLLQPPCSQRTSDGIILPSTRPRRQSNHQERRTWLICLCSTACVAFIYGALRLSVDVNGASATGPPSLASIPSSSSGANTAINHDRAGSEGAIDGLTYPVWWHAPFYTGSGYSTEAISYVTSLLQTQRFRRDDLWLSHSGDQILSSVASSLDPATLSLLQAQEYNNLVRDNSTKEALNRPAIAVCHSFPDCWLLPADRNSMNVPGCPCPPPEASDLVAYRVGRTMFETSGLPRHLVDHCNAMDEVWLPTEFNRRTFAEAGVAPEKIRVVPQGIDASQFDPDNHPPLVLRDLLGTQLITGRQYDTPLVTTVTGAVAASQDGSSRTQAGDARQPYVFLSVFKWETRKGWDVLLSSYLREFTTDEPVELHIITKPFGGGKQGIKQQVLSYLQAHLRLGPDKVELLPRVFLHTQHVDDAMYPRLYASCDCVVLPTRGEGWGRPQMEAMAMGKPIITTNWSGPTAYIYDEVAYPLSIDGLTLADADMNVTTTDVKQINEAFIGQYWAQPNSTHLRQLMRHVTTHPDEAAAKGRAARQHIQQHFTPEVLADVVKSEILRIQAKLGPGRILPPRKERDQLQSDRALCIAYPELCRQGAPGVSEASRRAQSAFSQYKTTNNMQLSLQAGRMTVQEMLAHQTKQQQQQAGGGIYTGKELAVLPTRNDVAVVDSRISR